MEKIIPIALALMVFGCLGQGAEGTPDDVRQPPLNETPPHPVLEGNITELPELPREADQTAPPAEVTEKPPQNVSNDTDAAGPPEPEPLPETPAGLRFGGYLLVLDDVSVIPTSDEPCGIFSILDASDYSVLDKEIICPGESKMYAGYRIFVVKVAAGYAGAENWADVRIYG